MLAGWTRRLRQGQARRAWEKSKASGGLRGEMIKVPRSEAIKGLPGAATSVPR